jgi:DNA-binding PadR family transcriptional regulator
MALMESPKHGYEIAKYIETRSNGFFRMPFGTLYPVLHRLEKEGLVDGSIDTSDSEREKKVYRLTAAGKRQAQGEIGEFQQFYKAVNRLVPG